MTMHSWLELLIARAAELRAAGITHVTGDGFSASLLPVQTGPVVAPALPRTTADQRHVPRVPIDPLDDPATYGGEHVPGYDLSRVERDGADE